MDNDALYKEALQQSEKNDDVFTRAASIAEQVTVSGENHTDNENINTVDNFVYGEL